MPDMNQQSELGGTGGKGDMNVLTRGLNDHAEVRESAGTWSDLDFEAVLDAIERGEGLPDDIPADAAADLLVAERLFAQRLEPAAVQARRLFEGVPTRQPVGEGAYDGIGIYLSEIGAISLLTADEEQELARRFELGRLAKARLEAEGAESSLDDAKRDRLGRQVRAGERAGAHLTEANLRLVVHIAKQYANRHVPIDDLIQDGSLGLMKAAERFDWRRGLRFSTYATWWIRQSIIRALAGQARTIRIPSHMLDSIAKLRAVTRDLEQELRGQAPTIDQIAAAMGMPAPRVEQMMQYAWDSSSMDASLFADSEETLGTNLADPNAIEPIEQASQQLLREALGVAMSSLPDRDRQILTYRYGLDDGCPHSLEEVAQQFGVSRERIRQIESQAIRRLRHPMRGDPLREFLR